ncbi:hypothetical protein [Pseudomonas fluorescens]|nr:hypothetical protein [Pseudomonas fluorescens]
MLMGHADEKMTKYYQEGHNEKKIEYVEVGAELAFRDGFCTNRRQQKNARLSARPSPKDKLANATAIDKDIYS